MVLGFGAKKKTQFFTAVVCISISRRMITRFSHQNNNNNSQERKK